VSHMQAFEFKASKNHRIRELQDQGQSKVLSSKKVFRMVGCLDQQDGSCKKKANKRRILGTDAENSDKEMHSPFRTNSLHMVQYTKP